MPPVQPPPGMVFVPGWGMVSMEALAQAQATMPPDRPGAFAEGDYLGVIAYMLQSNGGKPSAQPLTAATTARLGVGLDPQVALTVAASASGGAAV